MTLRVLLGGGAVAVAVAITAASCSGATQSEVPSAVASHFTGLPKGVTVPADQRNMPVKKPWAAWAEQRSIYVMTWGSSSCPRLPSSVKATDGGHVVIRTGDATDKVCTSDLGVTTSVVRLPSTVKTTRPLVVRIDGTDTLLR